MSSKRSNDHHSSGTSAEAGVSSAKPAASSVGASTASTSTSTSTSTTAPEKRLLLLDGHSLAFRAFYALPAENFSTTTGQHTNAVYGFISMFLTLVEQEKPTHIAAAFDLAGPTFRAEKFPEYKAQRPATPEEFKGQVDLIRRALTAMGVVTLDMEKYEADDIIATLSRQGHEAGFQTYICTGDRDSLQLVTDDVTVLYTLRGVTNLARFTPESVAEKYGVSPTQYPDLAALRGDTSDNMPGVPGVGPKTAQKWITKYGSLSELIENIDEIRGKVGDSLRENIDNVILARDITEMVRDLPLGHTTDELQVRTPVRADINELFDELQFGSNLRQRVFRVLGVPGDDDGAGQLPDEVHWERQGIASAELAGWLSEHAQGVPASLATAGVSAPADPVLTSLAVSAGSVTAIVNPAQLSDGDKEAFGAWLADPAQPKIVHDSKSVGHMLYAYGWQLRGLIHDTAIAAYLLRPELTNFDLDAVTQRYLSHNLHSAEINEREEKAKKRGGEQLSLSMSGEGSGEEIVDGHEPVGAVVWPEWEKVADCAEAPFSLLPEISRRLDKAGLYPIYENMEVPLAAILREMEHAGIKVNRDELEELRDSSAQRVDEEASAARELVGMPNLNLSSPKQLQEVLFDKLELPKTKKTKTGYSTAAKEIEQLAAKSPHAFLDHLLAHREYQKRMTTLDGLIKAIGPDGRIHTTFNQTATATGRLSSTEPNLQNIPVRTEEGRRIRGVFEAGEGYSNLLTADYSQIEMRVMAHLSRDRGLIEAYRSGEDLHNFVGSQVFDVPVDEVTPELRRRVKALSYGLVYGLSEYGLSQQLDIPVHEAKHIMNRYFERFGGVKRYLDSVVEQARKDGYTSTLFGRRRYLPDLTSTNRHVRENAERAALNAPIQGTAADIIKVAMIRVDTAMAAAQLQSRVLLQVHDELVVEIAAGEEEKVESIVRTEMDGAIELSVPLEVSVGIGPDWNAAAH